jgi:hypothetical protein
MNIFRAIINRNRKIDLDGELSGFYGTHRSGWAWAISHLKPLHNPSGVLLDSFIERSFAWNPKQVRTHKRPWIGFIHVPPNIPDWFQSYQSNNSVFQSEAFRESYPYCKGIFTLSDYHRKYLLQKLDIPINNLYHPTETPDLKWTWDNFEKNKEKKIIQAGWYLRQLHAIFQLPQSSYKKIFLKINYFDIAPIIEKERERLSAQGQFVDEMYSSAETVEFIPNNEYDKLLSENILFLNLYDANANNAVLESIVRDTPLLVNPIEAVREYLGEDYPFYYNTLEEAVEKAENKELVYKTHEYLKNHSFKEKLSGEYFLKSFKDSEIYKSL